jgi:hypothetical protein
VKKRVWGRSQDYMFSYEEDSRIVRDEIMMVGSMVLSDDYRLTDNESSAILGKSVFESLET